MRNARFENFQSRNFHFFLDFFFQHFRNFLTAAAQRFFVAVIPARDVIRIQTDNIAQRRIALDRKVFREVIHIEHRFCRVDDFPDDYDPDNDRIAEQAEEWAKEVLESGETMHLRPMNPAERRVVHKILADYSQLSTESEGDGRDRHIVLSKKPE